MKKLALSAGALVMAVAAQAQVFGDWVVDNLSNEPGVYALTANESGGVLGKSCAPNGCRWIITLQANCTQGDKYPALLNSESAAYQITLICAPNDSNPGRYVITEYESLDSAVRSGEVVGIAVPMKSGQFRVSRYGIKGWAAAEQQLRSRTATMLKRASETTL